MAFLFGWSSVCTINPVNIIFEVVNLAKEKNTICDKIMSSAKAMIRRGVQ